MGIVLSRFFVGTLLVLGLALAYYLQSTAKGRFVMKIGYGNQWRTVDPSIQHTLVGDLVIGNQFEALVGLDDSGKISPLGAKSWTISEDFRNYTFEIDTERTFSSGEKLTALHYKEAWESAAREVPASNNSSQLDVLYLLEGFEKFRSSGHIEGIKVLAADKLLLKFKRPYRMALDYLEGNRFSAFIKRNGKFYGTGRYIIESTGENQARFRWNEMSTFKRGKAASEIDVSVVYDKDSLKALQDGTIDAFAYGLGTNLPDVLPSEIGILVGQDAVRHCLQLNSNSGRVFSDQKLRRALQYLVYQALNSNSEILGNSRYTKRDFQIYMEIQAGRILNSDAEATIASGREFVPALVEATKKQPLVVLTPHNLRLQEALRASGLTLSPRSGIAPRDKYFEMMYNSVEPDIFMSGFSVAYGDPDGIYHKLGKNGAIASRMVVPGRVAHLLEEGRELTEPAKIRDFYQRLGYEFLMDVPIVHLGYSKAIAMYRKDRVRVNVDQIKRNEGLLSIFEEL